MFDHSTQARIQDLFRRENRSFLQYIRQSTPYASAAERPLVDKLNMIADEELRDLDALAVWMDAQRIPTPYLGSFPTKFSSFNFIAIRKLLKPLIAEQRKEIADLEADAKSLEGEAKLRIEQLVALNQKHLLDIEAIH